MFNHLNDRNMTCSLGQVAVW